MVSVVNRSSLRSIHIVCFHKIIFHFRVEGLEQLSKSEMERVNERKGRESEGVDERKESEGEVLSGEEKSCAE